MRAEASAHVRSPFALLQPPRGTGDSSQDPPLPPIRRQHHQEIATDLTDRDATERRITELYTKAVEQLGNDKTPVRLGGLYALERLAQDNPAQRQTIVSACGLGEDPYSRWRWRWSWPGRRSSRCRGNDRYPTRPRSAGARVASCRSQCREQCRENYVAPLACLI